MKRSIFETGGFFYFKKILIFSLNIVFVDKLEGANVWLGYTRRIDGL